MTNEEEKRQKKRFILLFFLCLIFASLSAFATVFLLLKTRPEDGKEDNPDVSVVETDDKDEKKNESGVSLEYSGYATFESGQNLVILNFANPARSTKSLSLEIVGDINGEEISFGKTDIIKPGNKVTSIKYTPEKELPKGRYDGKFVVRFYDEQDNEEIVVTNIDIKVYVK